MCVGTTECLVQATSLTISHITPHKKLLLHLAFISIHFGPVFIAIENLYNFGIDRPDNETTVVAQFLSLAHSIFLLQLILTVLSTLDDF